MAQAPPLVVVIHRVAALSALFLRSLQLARPKGTPGRRALGGSWVALMLAVAISSSWIPRFLELTWIPLFTLLPGRLLDHAARNGVRGHLPRA